MKAFFSPLWSRFNIVFTGTIALYGLAVILLSRIYGTDITVTSNLYSEPFQLSVRYFVFVLLFYRPIYVMAIRRPERLTRAIIADYKDIFFNPRRWLTALPVVICLPVFFSLFTSAKSMLPEIHPFDMDPLLASIDRIMHGGRQPWEWLMPVAGFALVTSIISFTYKTWFFTKFLVCIWQAFSLKRPRLREQFFLTFLFSWIVNGTILAILLSSAGPCYYGDVYPDLENPYAGLMAYLRTADAAYPVFDFEAMEYLWRIYSQHRATMFSGISAMPSMHVAVAFSFVLLGWRISRFMGAAFTTYLIAIMVGSVHIGWHYAVDGYVSILVTWGLWLLAGRWIGRDLAAASGGEAITAGNKH